MTSITSKNLGAIAIGLSMALSGCASTGGWEPVDIPSGYIKLTSTQIESVVRGNCIGRKPSFWKADFLVKNNCRQYNSNGRFRHSYSDKTKGNWWIKNHQLCTRRDSGNKDFCESMYRQGNNLIFTSYGGNKMSGNEEVVTSLGRNLPPQRQAKSNVPTPYELQLEALKNIADANEKTRSNNNIILADREKKKNVKPASLQTGSQSSSYSTLSNNAVQPIRSTTASSSNSSSSQRKTAPNVESCITFKRHLDVVYWGPAKHAINTCSYPVNFGSCVEDAPAGSPYRCQNYGKRYGGFGSGNRIKPGESKPVLGTVVHDNSQNKNHKYYNKVKFGACPLGSKGGYMEPNKDTGRYTCVLY